MLAKRRPIHFTVRVETGEGCILMGAEVGGKWLDKRLDESVIGPTLDGVYRRNRRDGDTLPRVTAQQCSVRLEGSIEPVDASKSSTALGWAGEVSLLLLFPGVRHGTYQPPVVPMPSLAGVICR